MLVYWRLGPIFKKKVDHVERWLVPVQLSAKSCNISPEQSIQFETIHYVHGGCAATETNRFETAAFADDFHFPTNLKINSLRFFLFLIFRVAFRSFMPSISFNFASNTWIDVGPFFVFDFCLYWWSAVDLIRFFFANDLLLWPSDHQYYGHLAAPLRQGIRGRVHCFRPNGNRSAPNHQLQTRPQSRPRPVFYLPGTCFLFLARYTGRCFWKFFIVRPKHQARICIQADIYTSWIAASTQYSSSFFSC